MMKAEVLSLYQKLKERRKEWKRTHGIDASWQCSKCGGELGLCFKCMDKTCPVCDEAYEETEICTPCTNADPSDWRYNV